MIDFTEILRFIQISCIVLLQGGYDFIGWKVKLGGSDTGTKAEKVYRVIKFFLDFPVTIWFMIVILHFSFVDIGWFYLLKWVHSCDRVYNWSDKLIYNKQPAYWAYWRFWTLWWGMIRTNWFGIIHIQKGYTYKDCMEQTGYFKDNDAYKTFTKPAIGFQGMKGMVNIDEVNDINNVVFIIFLVYYFGMFLYNNRGIL